MRRRACILLVIAIVFIPTAVWAFPITYAVEGHFMDWEEGGWGIPYGEFNGHALIESYWGSATWYGWQGFEISSYSVSGEGFSSSGHGYLVFEEYTKGTFLNLIESNGDSFL